MNVKTTVICVGTELLGGKLNSNSAFLGDRLSSIGLEPSQIVTVGDDKNTMKEVFRKAVGESNVVIVTGGLGPTFDDLTREAMAETLGRRLVLDRNALSQIARYFVSRNIDMPKNNESQAYLIEGAKLLSNPVGTAPGQLIETDKKPYSDKNEKLLVFLLPGPPREMQAVFEASVFPALKRIETGIKKSFTLHVCGMGESAVDEKIRPIVEAERKLEKGVVSFTILAHQMIVDIKTSVSGEDELLIDETLTNLKQELRDVLKENIYGEGRQTLESVLGELLIKNKKTLSLAESCTGGLVAHRITNIPGSSLYFKQAAVTYSNESKKTLLGVKEATLKEFGAVSEETVMEMAEGVKKVSGTDYSISLTGIAGPAGGTSEKPVGLVFVGISGPEGPQAHKFIFSGSRIEIRERAANFALDLLRRRLLNNTEVRKQKKKK
ncbi:MAG: competence/damage-inducible protein A [Endomicrobiales bacterium]|nr:competence/damage-inducible protein A [Endomicrobiales bacterium]